ncbi:TPA: CDP-diacylglycerol--serine O-phosphatidyltransferase [Candidatus Delongbacteria bacterium]|nr:MAG: CDP-diacylglycerol--serine O-phosphatidyltransferase [Candidatus Delongbacteria bacterium GWF2_40_14]HAQ62672.1 CDP-diacylglycerol--serine O-phosphatidyltransferase [Candidatus Delongbacteria bacterium]
MGKKLAIFPNTLTIGNMFFGYWSIISSIHGEYLWACYFVMMGGICDAFDGKVARLVKSTSDFGIEFDSLADVITFGAAPSVMMYMLYKNVYINRYPGLEDLGHLTLLFSFFPLLFAGIRLARFNSELVDPTVKGAFSGLPSPAAALTIVSFVFYEFEQYGQIKHFRWLTITSLVVSYLMISRIEYQGFPIMFKKGENFVKRNLKILGVVLFVVLIVKLKMSLLFPVMVIFVLSGLVMNVIEKAKRDDEEIEED